MRNRVDLHLHSTCSDGTDAPARVVELAARAGVETASLTDHDTIRGWEEARAAGERHGVRVVTGVEIGVVVRDHEVHLLAYLFDVPSPLTEALERLEEARRDRAPRILERLAEAGAPLTLAEVEAEAGSELLGRLHFAAALVRKRHVRSVDEAFARYLRRGAPAHVERDRLTPGEAIALAHRSGGVVSAAHPGAVAADRREVDQVLDELTSLGLDAVEVAHPSHGDDRRAHFEGYARARGLLTTGGSDFHGRRTPRLSVGRGRGRLWVDDATPARLTERAARHRARSAAAAGAGS